MGAHQTAVTGRRRVGYWLWKTLGVSALIMIAIAVALEWQASREYHAKGEFLHMGSLYGDVSRIVNTDHRAEDSPHTLTAAVISTIEDVWSVIIAENLGHDRCPRCDCRMMINPDLAAWRGQRLGSDLAVVCVRKGQSSHRGVNFNLHNVEVDTNRLPVWAKY